MNQDINEIIYDITKTLLGKKCWYVNCGGVGATFSLAMGRKILRLQPLKNKSVSDDFRKYEGDSNLLVWCSWRLDNTDGPLSSSDDTRKAIVNALSRLKGKKVVDLKIDSPCWDLQVIFTDNITLNVFCDHVPGDPSFDGNWELWFKHKAIFFGPGSAVEVQGRERRKNQRKSKNARKKAKARKE